MYGRPRVQGFGGPQGLAFRLVPMEGQVFRRLCAEQLRQPTLVGHLSVAIEECRRRMHRMARAGTAIDTVQHSLQHNPREMMAILPTLTVPGRDWVLSRLGYLPAATCLMRVWIGSTVQFCLSRRSCGAHVADWRVGLRSCASCVRSSIYLSEILCGAMCSL